MTPVDFLERLATLVPRPQLHLNRFHGILAPNAKLRALVGRNRCLVPTLCQPPLIMPFAPSK